MFARTSDRGEPAKINFCRLRTDSVENSPNSSSDGASRDRTFAGNCIALSIGLLGLVPGGGIEPPRAEARRILSPLRLPVPPSRLCLQVPDFTTFLWLCSPFTSNDE